MAPSTISLIMARMPRLYFDNAATSWPKPPAVYDAVDHYQRENGAAVGRSATRAGAAVQKSVDHARRQLGRLFHAPSGSIHFGFNGTDVLNIVLHGWLRRGDHVVTSVAEHNSVLRPLNFLKQRLGLEIDYLPVDPAGVIDPEAFRSTLRNNTRLIAVTHASNVTGAIQPVEAIGRIARERGVPFLIDAAQTAGHLPIDVERLNVDFLASSGHKGLLGPLGTGVLYINPERESDLPPLRQGGTGTMSEDEAIATHGPDRYEAGNHNAPGLVGLAAALDWIVEQGVERLRSHEIELTRRLLAGLSSLSGVSVAGPIQAEARVGTVSLRLSTLDPQTAASLLETEFGIECRAGLHCAPRMHAAIGSLQEGGTVRLSTGPFTTNEEIDVVVQAIKALVGA
jgi:cysteine desulfurase/selenocysteine lyase